MPLLSIKGRNVTKPSNASRLVLSDYCNVHNRCVPFALCSTVDQEDPEYKPFGPGPTPESRTEIGCELSTSFNPICLNPKDDMHSYFVAMRLERVRSRGVEQLFSHAEFSPTKRFQLQERLRYLNFLCRCLSLSDTESIVPGWITEPPQSGDFSSTPDR